MATLSKGILGGISGTVGSVIGGSWKGIDYIRSKPASVHQPNTQKQQDQRAKFKMVVQFLQCVTGLLRVSYRGYTTHKSGFNSAVSYTLEEAITGVSPSFSLDYSSVLISRGDLPNASNPAAAPGASAGQVTFSWLNNAGLGDALGSDKALLVVYSPAHNQAVYTTGSALRSALTETLNCAPFSGETVETWIGFISEDNRQVSTSTYTGQVTVV